jgi:hypothetical protein
MIPRRFMRNARHFWQYWISPVFHLRQVATAPRRYVRYLSSLHSYRRLAGAERLSLLDSYPCLFDNLETTPFDSHYFYQGVWALERILRIAPRRNIDIGSDVLSVGMHTSASRVIFVDKRPLNARLARLTSVSGILLGLPFLEGCIESLSCLHVAEHVGLGRYGDALTPLGTCDACAELKRVLAPGGHLFFSVPVGRPHVCFNAHRIHSPKQIFEYFVGLDFIEFSAVDDRWSFLINASVERLEAVSYGCGLFWFRRG